MFAHEIQAGWVVVRGSFFSDSQTQNRTCLLSEGRMDSHCLQGKRLVGSACEMLPLNHGSFSFPLLSVLQRILCLRFSQWSCCSIPGLLNHDAQHLVSPLLLSKQFLGALGEGAPTVLGGGEKGVGLRSKGAGMLFPGVK